MLTRAIALVTLVAFVAGCAGPAAKPKPAPSPPPAAVVPAPPPPTLEPLPSLPPASIGPRPATPPAEPPKVAEPVTPPPPPPTVPEVPPAQRGRFIVLNFDNADIETVIQAASEIVGFNYVLGPGVGGRKVTVQTSGRIAQEDVFGVLLAILEVNGVTAIKAGSLYKIVTIEGARERAVPTIVGPRADPRRTTDEVITQIVPLRYSSVTDLSTLLRPLISTRGSLIAHRETNVIILTDTASNVARLLDIVRLVDVQVALEELQIIPVKFADATQLAGILNQLFASGRIRSLAPGVPPVVTPPAVPGAPAAPQQPGAAAERPPLIIAEQRSNSLIVHAKKHEIETIRGLIGQLDVNIYGGRRVFVYYAENAKAKDLASTLNQIYGREAGAATPAPAARPGAYPTPPPPPAAAGATAVGEASLTEGQLRFIGDEVTNSVIVTTYPRLWQEIEGTIKQLDRMPRQVLIEVLVAEITLTDDIRLGIDWAMRQGRFNVGGTFANTGTTTVFPTSPPPGGGTLSLPAQLGPPGAGAASFLGPIGQGLTAFSFQTDQFFAILNALATDNRVNIVSNPHVLTSENKKAVINVSTSVPIVTSQQVPIGGTTVPTATNTTSIIGTQAVEYKDAGVILTVTPRIGERGTVALDVKQEVNAIGTATPPTGSLSFTKREAETSVVLLNNQTLVLGGLIQDKVTITDRGIPFLKDIPLIGLLFGFKQRTIEKTELLLLITPRVIGTALDAAKLTEQMRRATPELNETIRRSPRPPTNVPPPSAPAPAPAPGGAAPAPVPPGAAAPPPPAPLPPVTPPPAPPGPAPAPSR
jgi:general secretion pathway protein D